MILSFPVMGQQTPANAQEKSILITNAYLHLGDGSIISNGALGFKNGKITAVGTEPNKAEYEVLINADGKHLYPGFIAMNSTLGLVEVDAVRATRD